MENQLIDLPSHVQKSLHDFVQTAKEVCASNLVSAVLFGSAAEGRLRPTSDVNLILITKNFDVSQIDQLRETFRMAHASIHLNVMFLLESEIAIATEAFAVKFNDIFSRHRIIHGEDPFKNLKISREATINRLQQVIVNLLLRLRERYALVSLREEQLVPLIADAAGPIRTSAATILGLEGKKEIHPKEALETFVKQIPGQNWQHVLKNISAARELQELKTGEARTTMLGILELLKAMQIHVQGMK